MDKGPGTEVAPAPSIDAAMVARDWWRNMDARLLPGEEGGHTVFVIEFRDGCHYFGYTRGDVAARVASLMSEAGGWGSNAIVLEHGGSVPYLVRCVASNMDERQAWQLRQQLVAKAPGDVYVVDGTTARAFDCWLNKGGTEAEVISFSEWIKTREESETRGED